MWGATFPSQASIDGMVEAEQRSYDGWAELIALGQDDGSILATSTRPRWPSCSSA